MRQWRENRPTGRASTLVEFMRPFLLSARRVRAKNKGRVKFRLLRRDNGKKSRPGFLKYSKGPTNDRG